MLVNMNTLSSFPMDQDSTKRVDLAVVVPHRNMEEAVLGPIRGTGSMILASTCTVC